ncbi:hypothetical protein AX17_000622 [Amanita inopinata Kibby_2008]|nr:hypothetical protein AX17_000622 [Amanita inopinata Kibby_2008]
MTKGKNLNPADAYRKAQRKKELKKNKLERQKTRNFALVKKDTTELEDEIKVLEEKPNPSVADKARLSELKAELQNTNKKKAEYVAQHPEQRSLVYKRHRAEDEKTREDAKPEKRNLFNKKGLPRHPERSIYYDPVMNPYGVPPPGMPYMERPLLPGEADSDGGEDEDDIAMPEGPPPALNEEPVESDDEISIPEGPPPGQDLATDSPADSRTMSKSLSDSDTLSPPLPPPPPPVTSTIPVPFTPPPPGFPNTVPPPPPHGFPPGFPPPNYPHAFPSFPPTGLPGPSLPPPPPGFFPRRDQSASSIQDPLSSVPYTTYQAHRASRPLPSHPSLPSKPVTVATVSTATVSAEPQLRDFKKEATAFVPASLKRKRATTSTTKINAAPAVGGPEGDETEENHPARPDLVSTLRGQLGAQSVVKTDTTMDKARMTNVKKIDDYDKFMEEMSDILGSGS